jgi:hypothetical protein
LSGQVVHTQKLHQNISGSAHANIDLENFDMEITKVETRNFNGNETLVEVYTWKVL